jgi:hypothetical protein
MKTKKRTKRTGSSGTLPLLRRGAFIVVLLAGAASGRAADDRSFAVVGGTVFRDSGLSLSGAEIVLTPVPEPGVKAKTKKMQARSDARGEFALRVPAAPMRYNVTVTAAGFETWRKQVAVQGYERLDLSILLERSKR